MSISSTSSLSSTSHSNGVVSFGIIMERLHGELDKIKLGIVTPRESQAHQLALDLFEKAKEIKRKVIKEIDNPKAKIDQALKDVKNEIPTSRAFALAEILGHSGIQHDDELKKTLSLTTALFWELVGFQLSSQSRRIYKTDVEDLRKLLEKIFATLPKEAVETKFALKCFEATISRLNPGAGKVKEVFKDHAPEVLRGTLECAVSRSGAPAVSVLLNVAVRIYREIPLRWYRHTWLLTWGKEVKTNSEFDHLANYVTLNKGKSKAYYCFVNVIYDILVSPAPSQNSAQEPAMSSSSSSQPSTSTSASSSTSSPVDLKTYVFSDHNLSLLKLAETFPEENSLLKWRKKQKDRTFFDQYWKARYLCMIKLKQLIDKDPTSFKTPEAASVIGRRLAHKGERTYIRDAAFEALQSVPADAVVIAKEVSLCRSDSLEGVQRDLEATRIALEASQDKMMKLETKLQEIASRQNQIASSSQTSSEQLESVGRRAETAASDSDTSDDDQAELTKLQTERANLVVKQEKKSAQISEEMLVQEHLEIDKKIQEYLQSLLDKPVVSP